MVPNVDSMRYVIFVIDGSSGTASGGEMAAIDAFNDKLQAGGHWILAAGIGSPATGRLLDNRSGAGRVEQRSLNSADEYYSGFWVIEAATAELAESLAAEGSRACNRRVELRPFLR